MQRIKKDDEVVVIAGRDKGKRGKVLQVLSDGRALVNDINTVKKHVRGNPNKGEKGGIVRREAPIHLSNLALWNPTLNKGGRIGSKRLEDGRKVRYFKADGEVVDLS